MGQEEDLLAFTKIASSSKYKSKSKASIGSSLFPIYIHPHHHQYHHYLSTPLSFITIIMGQHDLHQIIRQQ